MHSEYVDQLVDIAWFFQHPRDTIDASIGHLGHVLQLHPALFGLSSIWLAVTISAAAILALLNPLWRNDPGRLIRNLGALLLVAAIVVMASNAVRGFPPLRSLVYLPVGVAVIAAMGYSESKSRPRTLLLALCGLAIVGNAAINNHLFASAAAVEFKDRLLAHEIIRVVQGVFPALEKGRAPLKVGVVGSLTWPETPIQHSRETLGASFFGWGGGLGERIAAYLTLNGLSSVAANHTERLRIYDTQMGMPTWPRDGWIKVSGDTLVLKLGEYSPVQRADLCLLGVRDLCQ